MALVVADRVKETTTSTGTGTINLAGAVTGFQTFVAGVGDTNTTYYAIIDPAGGTWEVGIGTVTDATPDTLSRDTIIASSNSGSAVSFGAGNKNVFSTQPADKAVYLDSSGQLVIGGVAVTSTAAELNYVDGVTSNIQTQLDSKLNLSGGTMTGALTLSGAPTADNHATTKIYVDELIAAGIHYHDPVRVESPDSAGSLTATYDNGTSGVGATLTNNGTQAALVIDDVTLNTNDRVLIYNQTNAFENGIYTVTNTGSASTNWVLTRATDADSYGVDNQSMSEGTSIFVLEGTDGSGEVYACTTTGTITFGTTAINFSQIGKSAVITGDGGITVTGNQVSANVDATVQTTAANSVSSTASRTYALQVDSGNDLVVNVPWTDTTTNQTITLSGDATGSGTTSISVSLATDSVGSNEIAANAVSASELNVTGNGTTSQFLRSDGDGSFTWATPTDTNTTYSAGSGLSLTGTTFANTAPDQTVTLTGSGATTVTGTYPNFTISSTDTDTNTTYSVATASTLGLVKIGYTENAKNYPVELSSGQMYVNVPWTDTTGNQTITLSGDVSGSGTSSITTTVANDSHTHDTRYYTETESDGRYYTEGGTGYNGTYPLLARIGARNAYSNNGITFTGSTNTLAVTGGITVGGNSVLTTANEGSGNGIDADTVDGIQGASFLRSDASDTCSGDISFTGGAGAVTITNSDIRSNATSNWTGDPGTQGKIQYHSNRWYIVADSSSNRIVQFRRNNSDKSYIDNNGKFIGTASSADNADTVDSLHASSFIRNDTSNSVTNYANKVTFFSNTNAATTSGSQASLECYSSGAGNDAFMAFHVGGDYATYFGLDGDTNDLFVGGWSKGASRYKIWHAGNDGSGSGLDADNLDGRTWSSTRNSANTLVTRDANGYTQLGWINTTSGATSSTIDRIYCSQDAYIRYLSPANFITQLGLWTSGNDGSGSGLDADLLDGYEATDFLIKDTANGYVQLSEIDLIGVDKLINNNIDTDTYIQFHASDQFRIVTGNAERLEVTNTVITAFNDMTVNGTLNVRTAIDLADNDILRFGSSDDAEFFCNGTHMYMDLNAGINNFYIRDGTTVRYTFDDNGSFTATGNVTAYSDIRLKENIEVIDDALGKVKQLRGVTFDRIDEEDLGRQTGLIAQEVEEVLPEAVITLEDEMQTKSVAYGNMVGLLIEAVKEQQQQIDDLRNEITALKGFE